MSKIRSILSEPSFNIGFLKGSEFDDLLSNRIPTVSWLKLGSYSAGWFADPFILEVKNDDIVLIAEEYEYKKRKGRISELVVDKQSFRLKSVRPVLETDTHLSFPYIINFEGETYICPENYQSGKVTLYRRSMNGQLIEPTTIINEPLVDTQFIYLEGQFYAFGVQTITGDTNESRTLKIYKSHSLKKPFEYCSEVDSIFAEERGAGAIFIDEGRIIRPAQSCERSYGDSLVFYQLSLNDNVLTERIIGKLYPKMAGRYGLGLHTFNQLDDVVVVDGKDYRRYPVTQLLKVFR